MLVPPTPGMEAHGIFHSVYGSLREKAIAIGKLKPAGGRKRETAD